MSPGHEGRAGVDRAVREVIASILPHLSPESVPGERHLRDLGADSVDRVEIVLGAMRRVGVERPLSSFSDLPSVDALVDYLCREGGR